MNVKDRRRAVRQRAGMAESFPHRGRYTVALIGAIIIGGAFENPAGWCVVVAASAGLMVLALTMPKGW